MKYILNNSEGFEIIKSGDSYGLVYSPSNRYLTIDDSENDGISYIGLSPHEIYANNMSDGFYINTKSADWSLGTPTVGNDMCNISGSSGDILLKSKKININSKNINIGSGENEELQGESPTINIGTPYDSGMSTSAPNIYTVALSKNENIGTYDLIVQGGFNITMNSNYGYGVNIIGDCYATAFYETSDENLKDFTDDITIDFNKLKEIRKSYFIWKDGDQNLHIGTSAQDIQKVYPELVSKDNKGNLTVDYAKLSIIALSAIDKLDERLSKIEKMLNIE